MPGTWRVRGPVRFTHSSMRQRWRPRRSSFFRLWKSLFGRGVRRWTRRGIASPASLALATRTACSRLVASHLATWSRAAAMPPRATSEGVSPSPHTIRMRGLFSDPVGDALTYKPAPASTQADVAAVSAIRNGAFTVTGKSAGTATVRVSVTDGKGTVGRPVVRAARPAEN